MDNNKTACRPKFATMAGPGNARAIEDDTIRRALARKAYRAQIKSLLDESSDTPLAEAWQRVYPFPVDPACELPDRRGIIEDLADFAEVLQPSLDGMKANRLCRLIEKYAACGSSQSDPSVSLACQTDWGDARLETVSGRGSFSAG
jgi:hypothetical protein